MRNIWDDLLRSALVGAERLPLQGAARQALAAAGMEPATGDPARDVLDALAAARLLKKSAAAFDTATCPPPAPEETAPRLSPQTGRYLDLILSGAYRPALPEFIELTRHSGCILPPEHLPALLDQCLREPLFPHIRHLLGARGQWLLQLNPAWQALGLVEPEAPWATADLSSRMVLLQHLRRAGDPEAIRLLESTWKEESVQDKKMLLPLLTEGLSGADEIFFERAATDKNKDVRLLGLQLLVRLPQSRRLQALGAFFRSRLAGFLTAADTPAFLQETIPDFSGDLLEYMQEWVVAQPAEHKRPALLELLLSLLPPQILEETSGWPPPRILQYLDDTPGKSRYLPPLLEAAAWHGDTRWLRAALEYFATQPEHNWWKTAPLEKLLLSLPPDLWQENASRLALLEALWDDSPNALQKALASRAETWPAGLLQSVLTQTERLLRTEAPVPYQWLRVVLEKAAYQGPPEEILAVRELLFTAMPSFHPLRRELEQLWDVARFRKKMRDAIQATNRRE